MEETKGFFKVIEQENATEAGLAQFEKKVSRLVFEGWKVVSSGLLPRSNSHATFYWVHMERE